MFLTSNGTRDLSEALKRRCLYLHLDYPSVEREREIVLARVPELPAHLAAEVARVVRSLRMLDLRKPPSVSETLDWARTLVILGIDRLDAGRDRVDPARPPQAPGRHRRRGPGAQDGRVALLARPAGRVRR